MTEERSSSKDSTRRPIGPVDDSALALSVLAEALALAIDAASQSPRFHLQRVRLFAERLAERVGMTDVEIKALGCAALLHDIGKLAVPGHIFANPRVLTAEEFNTLRRHPSASAQIIGAVPFSYPVVPYILSHHERWSGDGYPQGLKGERIPLGARVLSIVDYYDALRTDAPYHEGMGRDEAVAQLHQEAGKGLDPSVVAEFVALLPALEDELANTQHQATGDVDVFKEIALAHRETPALYALEQALGDVLAISDTMEHLTTTLPALVPFSSCALFLREVNTDKLRCRFASGIDSETLLRLELLVGAGATGWVAHNRRPIVNARPSADLEASGDRDAVTALRSSLICPLVSNDVLMGTLNVYHVQPAFYSNDHMRLFDRITERVWIALNRSILFESAQMDALTDPLTDLPNTRFLFMHLTRELARAERLKTEVAVLVIDVDGFRAIKDRHGFGVGDRVLREIARVLRGELRPYDVCVRYARDEFIVVLSGAGPQDAERTRQRLQQAVRDIGFDTARGPRLQLSVGIGAAVFPEDGKAYETLLATADARMAHDKNNRKPKA